MSSRTVHFVALGCPKNRVDTERMAGLAQRIGLQLVADPQAAEIIVVNTCGFIQPATEESIETVLELGRLKQTGRCTTLVMAGCLAQRHADELAAEMPEVDHFIGTENLPQLAQILRADAPPSRVAVSTPGRIPLPDDEHERLLSSPLPSAYLKIAEGCDRRCSFCIIPELRGRQRSRAVGSLVREAERLVAAGARELVLVAQDTTAYGRDLEPPARLVQLLEALDSIAPLRWIRVLYAYPTAVDRELMRAMARLSRVVPYLDLPLQHVDDGVLRAMRRGHSGDLARRVIDELRREVPGVFLRSTLLVGHPAETAAAHRALLDFVAAAELDHLGVFPFSPEEGTAAAALPDRVPAETARERAEEVLQLQREISRRRLARLHGEQLEVLVEGPSEESEYLVQGRHAGQAPEVDGVVILADCAGTVRPGEMVRATVTDSGDYDLVATPAE
jgi:ribosomal protein S12 methylthiotransferase